MEKRLSLEDKAKIANGNERHCRQCNHHVCPDGLLKVCSEAFIRGYKKGYKQNQKEQKERIDKILHPVTEPCGSNAIFVFFRDVRSGELQPYIEDMRMPDAKCYQDIGSIRFSPEKDEPQKLQIAWCYPKDLVKLLGYDKKYADFERIALSEGAFSYPREEYERNLQKYSALRYEYKKYYHYKKFKKQIFMDKKDISLIVTLELCGDLCGMTIKDKNDKVVQFEDLVRSEQIKILNCLSQNYNFLVRFLKEKEG